MTGEGVLALYFSDSEAVLPTTTVLPSACSSMDLFGYLVERVFYFRGSIVKMCISFGSTMFIFSIKLLSNAVGAFLVSKTL